MSKIFYQYELAEEKIEKLAKIMNYLEQKSVQSLSKNLNDRKNFVLPGTHDLLMSIGESFCIRLCIDSKSEPHFIALLNSFVDYSINLERGIIKFMEEWHNLKKKSLCDLLMKKISNLFRSRLLQAVVESQKIDNILNLKTVTFNENFFKLNLNF